MRFILLASLFLITRTYNIAVVGASSDLGKEIIYQGIVERRLNIIGFTSNNKISLPYRGDSFNKKIDMPIFNHKQLTIENYWDNLLNYEYKHLIFSTSASPFQKDYSDILTEKFLINLPKSCESISLVSAFGVGNSLETGNLGIQIMNSLYLKDVYRAKNRQEELVENLDLNITKLIYRPKALSYGYTKIESIPRDKFARMILDDLNL